MLFFKALPSLLTLSSTIVAQALSQSIAPTNLTTDVTAPPRIPAATWHPPNTITYITLVQKQPYRGMSSDRLFQFMLTARIELQVQAQLAGGMHLPLMQPFEKYGAEFGIYIEPQSPIAPMTQWRLLYTDVEVAFTAVERQLSRIGNAEALIRILRWGVTPQPVLAFGVIGLKQSVSLAVNGTGMTLGESANITDVDGGSGVLATA